MCDPHDCLHCAQGRLCPRRLHQDDGGHHISNGRSKSIEVEPDRSRLAIKLTVWLVVFCAIAEVVGFHLALLF
jgi:hypothetical protein